MAFYSSKMVKSQTQKKHPILWSFIIFLLVAILSGGIVLAQPQVQQKISLYRCYVDVSLSSKQYGAPGQTIALIIPTGADTLTIGKLLQEKGVIASTNDFLCYINKIDAATKIQAGYYELNTPISLEQVVPSLQNAKIPTVWVTIQEGLRLDEIADQLDKALGKDNIIKQFDKTEFLTLLASKGTISSVPLAKGKASLEGFLFPDTYQFEKNVKTSDVLETLLDTYKKKVTDPLGTNFQQADVSPYNVMVLASLIQKEAGKTIDEKKTISGIFMNRLKANWPLGSDVTSLYIKKDWHAELTAQDLVSNSSYNTRNHTGLPPTPICNPGLDSIEAALHPKATPYWYFIYDTKGVVHYAKTLAEHNQNIALYLR